MIEASQPFGKNKWPGAHADPSPLMMLPQKRVDPLATRSYAPIYPLQLRLVDNTGTSFMKTLVLRLMFFAIHEGFNIFVAVRHSGGVPFLDQLFGCCRQR